MQYNKGSAFQRKNRSVGILHIRRSERCRALLSKQPQHSIAKLLRGQRSCAGNMVQELDYDVLLKLVLLGDQCVGKTSLSKRLVQDDMPPNIGTIGVDWVVYKTVVGDKKVKLQIWDTNGRFDQRSVIKHYFPNAVGIVFVYDITSEKSFEGVQNWMQFAEDQALPKVLVGNKVELAASKRAVSYERGKALADQHGMQFFETSAVLKTNVVEVFRAIAEAALARQPVLSNASHERTQDSDMEVLLDKPTGKQKRRSCFCFCC